jgi:hypothetical protein
VVRCARGENDKCCHLFWRLYRPRPRQVTLLILRQSSSFNRKTTPQQTRRP